MKTLFAIVIFAFLAGCCVDFDPQDSASTLPKDEFIASLKKPTDLSELTPYKLEGKLIYYLGNSKQNPTPVSGAKFDKTTPDMTVDELVNTLGPGFSRSDQGLAFISWYCEDGRELHIHMNISSLNQVPKIHKYKQEKDS